MLLFLCPGRRFVVGSCLFIFVFVKLDFFVAVDRVTLSTSDTRAELPVDRDDETEADQLQSCSCPSTDTPLMVVLSATAN